MTTLKRNRNILFSFGGATTKIQREEKNLDWNLWQRDDDLSQVNRLRIGSSRWLEAVDKSLDVDWKHWGWSRQTNPGANSIKWLDLVTLYYVYEFPNERSSALLQEPASLQCFLVHERVSTSLSTIHSKNISLAGTSFYLFSLSSYTVQHSCCEQVFSRKDNLRQPCTCRLQFRAIFCLKDVFNLEGSLGSIPGQLCFASLLSENELKVLNWSFWIAKKHIKGQKCF